MNKLIVALSGLIILTSCATSRVAETSKNIPENKIDTTRLADIKQAVEMRRFLVKFDRLHILNGGQVDLIARSNYIILDGNRVVISAAYVGRQYSFRPIKGIDMVGKVVAFELKNNSSKGTYQINMKVKNDTNTFDVYLTISKDGYCDASVNNYKIDHVRYTGNFIPLKPKVEKAAPDDLLL